MSRRFIIAGLVIAALLGGARLVPVRQEAGDDPWLPVAHEAAAGDRDGGGGAFRAVDRAPHLDRHADRGAGRGRHQPGGRHRHRGPGRERHGARPGHEAGSARHLGRGGRSRQRRGYAQRGRGRLCPPGRPDEQEGDVGGQPRHRASQAGDGLAAVNRIEAVIAQKAIVAPFSGRVGIRKVEKGQYVSAGMPLVSLQALDPIRVDFPMPEQHIGKLQRGRDRSRSLSTRSRARCSRARSSRSTRASPRTRARCWCVASCPTRSASCCLACSPTWRSWWARRPMPLPCRGRL